MLRENFPGEKISRFSEGSELKFREEPRRLGLEQLRQDDVDAPGWDSAFFGVVSRRVFEGMLPLSSRKKARVIKFKIKKRIPRLIL